MARNLNDIKAFALDIDGVLTDGSIIPLSDGDLLRIFNAKDSMAMRVASLKGLITAIISGGDTEALRQRCLHCGIKEENLFLGCRGKLPVLFELCRNNGLKPEDVAYVGDDIPDVPIIRECGFGIAPADAAVEAVLRADVGALDESARQDLGLSATRLDLPRRRIRLAPKSLVRVSKQRGDFLKREILRRNQRPVKQRHFSS